MDLVFILILIAVVLFVLAGLGVSPRALNLGWLGLAFLAISMLAGCDRDDAVDRNVVVVNADDDLNAADDTAVIVRQECPPGEVCK